MAWECYIAICGNGYNRYKNMIPSIYFGNIRRYSSKKSSEIASTD